MLKRAGHRFPERRESVKNPETPAKPKGLGR
jgi:hypothetical protein